MYHEPTNLARRRCRARQADLKWRQPRKLSVVYRTESSRATTNWDTLCLEKRYCVTGFIFEFKNKKTVIILMKLNSSGCSKSGSDARTRYIVEPTLVLKGNNKILIRESSSNVGKLARTFPAAENMMTKIRNPVKHQCQLHNACDMSERDLYNPTYCQQA